MGVGNAFGQNIFFRNIRYFRKKVQNGILNEDENSLQINTTNWNHGHYIIQIIQRGNRFTHRLIE